MDSIEAKMSKSNPENSIFIHDSPEEIDDKLRKAYCPEGQMVDNPIIDICKFILFNRLEQMLRCRSNINHVSCAGIIDFPVLRLIRPAHKHATVFGSVWTYENGNA